LAVNGVALADNGQKMAVIFAVFRGVAGNLLSYRKGNLITVVTSPP
jgi:hypothetical protein